MSLFKRRNAVKAKQPKNVPNVSTIVEDEASIISEINSMLNELVTSVSEQTDSALKNGGHTNSFSETSMSKQLGSSQERDACSSPTSTNNISQQKDSSLQNDKCSSSTSRNSISEQKSSAQENDTRETVVQGISVSKEIAQKNEACAVQTNDVSKQTNSSLDNDACMNPTTATSASKQRDPSQKYDDCTSSAQVNDVSNISSQKSNENENLIATNDISNQINPAQTNYEGTNTPSTNDISKEIDSAHNECEKPVSANNVSNIVKQEIDDSNVTKIDSSENELSENISTHEKKIAMKKTRSSSECGAGIESQTKFVRRKFGSEAEVMSICGKILPPEQQKGINEAVVKYIDNLIKDSLFKAVRSINIDNLCEELVKDVSNRKNSESAESEEDYIVEQRLSSSSISELVEFQNVGNEINEDQKDSLLPECEGKVSETESLENDASFGGYLADLEDTASVDDLKSIEEDSLYNSSCSGLENKLELLSCNSDSSGNRAEHEFTEKTTDKENGETMTANVQTVHDETKAPENSLLEESTCGQKQSITSECADENEKPLLSDERNDQPTQIRPEENLADKQEQKHLSNENSCENDKIILSTENLLETDESLSKPETADKTEIKTISTENSEKSLDEETLLMKDDLKEENKNTPKEDRNSNQDASEEERMKVNWRVGYLQVKLPHKSRGKTSLKAWKKRRVVIQPDEFVNDPTNQSLVISVYGSKKHETTFWHSVSSQKAVIFRSSSHTHRYAFTISEGGEAIIHLSAENESDTQEWMAAIRAALWPPSPFMELEKMLSGQEFEVSIIDNEFSYHAGLLGMYGYLSITPKKLILLHPQQGYVIQEWYLNTVDKFQFVLQPKADDMHKVLCMTTCKDSSTGKGEITFFCKEAVTLLQALATTIHQVLSYHSKQEGGKYQKELEELAEWMVAPPQDCLNVENDEHYKVPPRQVKSLLDIPNFIFNKPLSPVASAIYPAPKCEVIQTMDATKNKLINTSQDSGISNCTSGDDFLNCSTASFVLGGGPMTGVCSDSELSDTYTPPRTPEITKKKMLPEVVKEEVSAIEE